MTLHIPEGRIADDIRRYCKSHNLKLSNWATECLKKNARFPEIDVFGKGITHSLSEILSTEIEMKKQLEKINSERTRIGILIKALTEKLMGR